MAGDRRLPAETLSPLAARVEAVLALYDYELTPATDAIDEAVPGFGGLFDPNTTDRERRAAIETVMEAGLSPESSRLPATDVSRVVLYVDGSARGNPGPAGAGAVIRVADTDVVCLGRPVGSRTDNNVAEFAALQMGLDALARRCGPVSVEIRIDSMTVVNTIWGDSAAAERVQTYSGAIKRHLAALPDHEWTHLVDSDPNPADAYATVGADIAALGPG